MKDPGKRLGLALSGGGYRAAAFHLGTLNKLHQLGVLQQVDVLSTISGGSITGAAWCLHEGDYPSFHQKMATALTTRSVIGFILRSAVFWRTLLLLLLFFGGAVALSLTRYSYATFPVLLLFAVLFYRFQFQIFPVSREIEKAYDRFFCHRKTLGQLPQKPLLAIGSSNLHTGRPFTFSRNKMSDSSYGYRSECQPPIHFRHENFPVARAVVASSCVPFAFSPVTIAREFFQFDSDFHRIKPVLIDGGVYDNQGIQKLTQPGSSYECDLIITSDAGGNFMADKRYPNTLALLLRTVDLFMYRIKTVQMVQNIYRNVQGAAKPIAYFSLGWRLQNAIPGFYRNLCQGQVLPEVLDAHGILPQWRLRPEEFEQQILQHLEQRVDYPAILRRDLTDEEWSLARNTGTNLTAISRRRLDCLVRHAENLTELQVRLYCPSLLTPNGGFDQNESSTWHEPVVAPVNVRQTDNRMVYGQIIGVEKNAVLINCAVSQDPPLFEVRRFDLNPFQGYLEPRKGMYLRIIITNRPGSKTFEFAQVNRDLSEIFRAVDHFADIGNVSFLKDEDDDDNNF